MKLLNLKKNNKYLLALSYGSDSLALFYLLLNKGYNFEVAYCNYHLPYTGDMEEIKIKELCKKYNKILHLKEVYFKKGNEEAWARKERYDFFIEIIKNNSQIDACLIAHNKDDLVETYYLQKNRPGYYSYYGLKEISFKNDIKFIRPLLHIRKAKLKDYNDKNGYKYFQDVTDLEPRFERNKIRLNQVSIMSNFKINKVVREIKFKNYLKEKEKIKYSKLIKDDNLIYIKDIKNLKVDEFTALFYIYLSKIKYIKNISKDQILDLHLKLQLNKNLKIDLKDNYYIFVEYGYLKIDKIYFNDYYYKLNKNGNDIFKFKKDSDLFNKIFNKYEEIIIKPISRSEKYLYKGEMKSISKIFIDMKLPISYRNIYPGIYNEKGEILYIPRYKKDFKIGEETFLIFNMKNLLK